MHRTYLAPIAALLIAGCASGGTSASPAQGTTASEMSGAARWSGNFQQQQQRQGGLGPTAKNRAFGTVSLSSVKDDANRTQVQINLNAPVQSGQQLAWGVFPGRCGSGSGLAMPLVATNTLPPLDVIRNGGAQLNTEIAFTMPKSGSYHFNVFWTSRTSDLSDILTCANLVPSSK